MQRLRAAENRGHSLNRSTNDIVLRLLRGERGAGGLGMEAQHPGTRTLSPEVLAHNSGPHTPGSSKLGDLFQEIVMRVEEERNPGGELVDVKTRVNRRLYLGDAIAQSEGDFLHGGGSRLAHVISGD